MATAGSGEGCSDPAGVLRCVLVDPVRLESQAVTVPLATGRSPTIAAVLEALRSGDGAGPQPGDPDPDPALIARRRFTDGLFGVAPVGGLGPPQPGLIFRAAGRPIELEQPLEAPEGPEPIAIEVDRSRAGYPRDWPAFLDRRWRLRAGVYTRFVESVVRESCADDALTAAVLRLDTPERSRRFLGAIAARIHRAPYETYSRYLAPATPFRTCDQALDRILEGDGGNCAEKAMALYFVANAYGLRPEIVLGGEQAAAKFPFRALRAILDQKSFHSEVSRDSQRYWQHYAILCQPGGDPEQTILCDVAGSNIPFQFLDRPGASAYLDPESRRPLPVQITLEPIDLYYHRLEARQDIPLDLCYAMEHLIPAIDLIHTVDNDLGLLHTGGYWLGVIVHRNRRELAGAVQACERLVRRAGREVRDTLAIVPTLEPGLHPLFDRFDRAQSRFRERLRAADAGLRRRLASIVPGSQVSYVLLRLDHGRDDRRSSGSALVSSQPGRVGSRLLRSISIPLLRRLRRPGGPGGLTP